MLDFSNKRVLITGGGRGIGRGVAQAFARQQAHVAINYRTNDGAAQETLDSLVGDGHSLIKVDISTAKGAKDAVDKTIDRLGGLDIVVNNAGIFRHHPIAETSYDEWQSAWHETLSINLFAPANICYCAARYMIEQGGGRIVNISSRGAFRGEPDYPAYGASKAGLNSMSQSLAVTLAPHNIFVGVVAPGFVDTELVEAKLSGPEGDAIRAQSPLNRVGLPEEIAHAVLFLCSDGAEYSTGAIIDVNGASYLRS